jgi:tetratricopeptide (TPR) repeat protein
MSTLGHNARRATSHRWIAPGVCLLLIAIVWAVFGQTLRHDFVNFDDGKYVYENAHITSGLSARGVLWAFTHSHGNNWHPLTSISHMLDCQLFGLKAGGHHFANVFLHTIATILLFLALREMTGSIWRSAFVAALFAIHPLHVESVAWVAERKDVLSAVFFMLTLGAYVRYVRQPSRARYVAMSILFACGLMSKPMLVTVPFVLILLDYWPLQRKSSARKLILEKIPLVLLAAASSIATLLAQGKAISPTEALSFPLRINNALVTCITYIWQMIWPAKLAVYYPHPYERLPLFEIVLACALLVAVSAIVFVLRKRRPYLITGWLWYLSMLVPVIGIIQVGTQGRADRYTYLPHIGLYILITWAIFDLTANWRYRRPILCAATAIVLGALTWCASIQASYWRDSKSLWTHTLVVTSNNDIAHNNLGLAFQAKGQVDDAIAQYHKALQTDSGAARYHLAIALAHNNLGFALVQKGSIDEAISHFEKAVKLSADYADAHYNLGNALLQTGRIDDALPHLQKTLSIQPDDPEARTNLANALSQKGQLREAVAQYAKVLEIAPDSIWALNDLAWMRATSSDASFRNGAEAIELALRAIRLSREENPIFLRTLAAAYGESGRFGEAIETARRASDLALRKDDGVLARHLGRDVDLYQTNSALRETPRPNAQP